MHLPIIDGHAVFPDFRIEYEDERGDLDRVDVEIANDNYRDHHIWVSKVCRRIPGLCRGADIVPALGSQRKRRWAEAASPKKEARCCCCD